MYSVSHFSTSWYSVGASLTKTCFKYSLEAPLRGAFNEYIPSTYVFVEKLVK